MGQAENLCFISTPKSAIFTFQAHSGEGMVGMGRLELPTSRLSVVRSSQLSYTPMKEKNVQGFRPQAQDWLASQSLGKGWWRLSDSNR